MKNTVKKRIFPFILAALILASAVVAACVAGCANASYRWFKKTIKENYYYPVSSEDLKGDDLKEIAARCLDKYSGYYTMEEYEVISKSNDGSKSGLGLNYAYYDGMGVYVSSVVGNSPAYMCGLRAGEWLESGALNGEEIVFESSADFANLVNSAADGEEIKFTSADGEEFYAAKAEYTAYYTRMATNNGSWVFAKGNDGEIGMVREDGAEGEGLPYLPDGTAYISISQFYGTAASEFDCLLRQSVNKGCTSLILDLRSNGGGYVSVMQEIAYAFSGDARKLAMLSRDKHGKVSKYYCKMTNEWAFAMPKDMKVYVLANSGTASASEALIGCMICYGVLDYENIFISDYSEEYLKATERAGKEIKTGRTYGKGIMQSTFSRWGTFEVLKLTTAQIYWPDETTCIHDRGVTVDDGCTPVRADWQHTKGDEELQRAARIISARG